MQAEKRRVMERSIRFLKNEESLMTLNFRLRLRLINLQSKGWGGRRMEPGGGGGRRGERDGEGEERDGGVRRRGGRAKKGRRVE